MVDEEEEWDRIPRTKRMALVSQSTQPPWKFQKLAAFMVSRAHELKIVNTVCPVTIRRQEDTIELAQQVDMMVVVGGRNSANTRELTRLVGIAGTSPPSRSSAPRSSTDATIFDGYRVVGITGGTSTPIEDLETVPAGCASSPARPRSRRKPPTCHGRHRGGRRPRVSQHVHRPTGTTDPPVPAVAAPPEWPPGARAAPTGVNPASCPSTGCRSSPSWAAPTWASRRCSTASSAAAWRHRGGPRPHHA